MHYTRFQLTHSLTHSPGTSHHTTTAPDMNSAGAGAGRGAARLATRAALGPGSGPSSSSGSGLSPGSGLGTTAVVWYRASDLRMHDHEALYTAHCNCQHDRVLHVFCFDDRVHKGTTVDFSKSLPVLGWKKCGVFKTEFLRECVVDLQQSLEALGQSLVVRSGIPEIVIPELALACGASDVYCHEAEASEEHNVQVAMSTALRTSSNGVCQLRSLWGNTLYHIDDLNCLKLSPPGKFPKSATQFRTVCEKSSLIRAPLPGPQDGNNDECNLILKPPPTLLPSSAHKITPGNVPSLATLMGDSYIADMDQQGATSSSIVKRYQGGETAGLRHWNEYLWDKDLLRTYFHTRNGMLGEDYSTKLSPWLAAGCISPRRIVSDIRRYEATRVKNKDTYWLIFELTFRDYFRYYVHVHGNSVFKRHGPQGKRSIRQDPATAEREWSVDATKLDRWRKGQTGNAMVDACMRELQTTGYMSNRGRQIVASFLTRDYGLDWRLGAMHFESLLVDHDVCLNWGNWTYAAGVGSDPREDRYFSVPKQTKNYDSDYRYIHHWVPESLTWSSAAMQSSLRKGTRSFTVTNNTNGVDLNERKKLTNNNGKVDCNSNPSSVSHVKPQANHGKNKGLHRTTNQKRKESKKYTIINI